MGGSPAITVVLSVCTALTVGCVATAVAEPRVVTCTITKDEARSLCGAAASEIRLTLKPDVEAQGTALTCLMDGKRLKPDTEFAFSGHGHMSTICPAGDTDCDWIAYDMLIFHAPEDVAYEQLLLTTGSDRSTTVRALRGVGAGDLVNLRNCERNYDA